MVRKMKIDLTGDHCQYHFSMQLRVSHRNPKKLARSPPNTGPMAMLKLRTAKVNDPGSIQRAVASTAGDTTH